MARCSANAVIRSVLASGQLGHHHGLPVTIIITAALDQLHTHTGVTRTAGDSALPISEVIRLARHARHYLAIFDDTGRHCGWATPNAWPPRNNASC